jgi:transcriptional regulator with GAF, ATPase, and Fis domain
MFSGQPDVPRANSPSTSSKRHPIHFLKVFGDLSARFINVPADRMNQEIEAAQEAICEALGLDRCSLWLFSEERESLVLSHLWARSPDRVPPGVLAREEFPWINRILLGGGSFVMSSLDALPPEASADRASFQKYRINANATFPVLAGGNVIGALAFAVLNGKHEWQEEELEGLKIIAQTFSNALDRKKTEEDFRRTLAEVSRLKDMLQAESEYLRREVGLSYEHADIVGESAPIKHVLHQIEQVSGTDSTVLITGETGTGKELVAREIHRLSRRKDRVLVKVDCASLPVGLVESELFGRERGAYTGAMTKQIGRFQIADKSTIFLDEIGELAPEVQGKLLRVLDDGEFEPLGGAKTSKVDVRVIAATNRDLHGMVRQGKFREDLLFRLCVFPIKVPPLRERVEDILPLVWAYIRRYSAEQGKSIRNLPKGALEALQAYSWPGNVRELKNLIEYAFIVSSGDTLKIRAPADQPGEEGHHGPKTLEQAEHDHIVEVLRRTAGRIKGKGGAAGLLDLRPSTLYAKMKKLGIPLKRDRDSITT